MHKKYLLIVTAVGEGITGLALLAAPAVVQPLLLGVDRTTPEATVAARIAGAALLALALACWAGRGSAQRGLLLGVSAYDVGAAVVLACAGLVDGLAGVALWPAVAAHAALAAWCVACLLRRSHDG